MADNKVLFGLKNVHYALITNEATPTYAVPVAVPGSVALALAPEGGQENFYADNIAYYVSNTNNGYKGTVEMALLPDAMLAALLGWEIDENGVLVEIADAESVPFALLYEVDGNEQDKRYIFYKCIASRPKEERGTKSDKTDIKTGVLDITVTPIEIDDTLVVKGSVENTVANAAVYAAWYTAVTVPTFAVS
jgi:phi13 family phage major tail protein